MEPVHIVQEAVPGLRHQRQAPVAGVEVLLRPGDGRLVHRPHAVGVRDHHRPFEQPAVPEPGGAGHLAVAVQGEPRGEDPAAARPAPRQDRGDAGAYRPLPHSERPVAANDGVVADLDAGHIGDRVQRPRRPVEGDAERPGAGAGLLGRGRPERGEAGGEQERRGGAAGKRVSFHGGSPSGGKRTGSAGRQRPEGAGGSPGGGPVGPRNSDPAGAGGRKRSVRRAGGGPARSRRFAATRNLRARRSA